MAFGQGRAGHQPRVAEPRLATCEKVPPPAIHAQFFDGDADKLRHVATHETLPGNRMAVGGWVALRNPPFQATVRTVAGCKCNPPKDDWRV
jgi:hypothetical protein